MIVVACLAWISGCYGSTKDTDGTDARASVAAEHEAPCALLGAPVVLREEDGAVLLTWEMHADPVFFGETLPTDSSFGAYRAAMVRDGADVVYPVADPPTSATEAEAQIWEDEFYNRDLAFAGGAGVIEPVTCLDALLFAWQAQRVPPIERPTEFLASVLRRSAAAGPRLAVVFGAGAEMFPPRWAYGLDVVDRYRSEGWSYWYSLHNHTPQRNGELLALGVPVPSTSDVGLARALFEDRGMELVRVTNGFYTFSGTSEDLAAFRAR